MCGFIQDMGESALVLFFSVRSYLEKDFINKLGL